MIYSIVSGMCLNTDWLGVSVLFDNNLPSEPPPQHHWQVCERGTAVWDFRAILWNQYGEKVCTVLAKPKSTSFLHVRAGLIEIANEWLYHGIGVGGVLDLVHWSASFTVTGLSRLDLCMDFQPSPEQVDIIKGLSEKRYYVVGKQNRVEFCGSVSEPWANPVWNEFCPYQQSWGHKTTQVKWKLYYKSKELRDNGGGWFDKPYIVDCWRKAGIDENNAWRLEVSLVDCNSLILDGNPITYARWVEDMESIYTSLYVGRFKVRVKEGHKDKTNDKELRFLPIDTAARTRCKHYEPATGRSARVSLLRSLVKYGEKEEVFMDEVSSRALCEHVERIVMNDDLERYFKEMTGKTLGQWTKEMVDAREGKLLRDNAIVKNWDIHENSHFDDVHPRGK